ncbi:hypothetical protein MPH_10983 [Macrophomina phaseolina MS6]|uniref:Uncharacterized protein n=1 Tax=Macrophomina phaseolina (strain MS6) TaxID=1126212 RepID=K2RP31_MACPH|nr:hypothetical protein MPH_10983 [Macrophomina phaseolina MS6]
MIPDIERERHLAGHDLSGVPPLQMMEGSQFLAHRGRADVQLLEDFDNHGVKNLNATIFDLDCDAKGTLGTEAPGLLRSPDANTP